MKLIPLTFISVCYLLSYKPFSHYSAATHKGRRQHLHISAITRAVARLSQSIRLQGLIVFQFFFFAKKIASMLYCIVTSGQHVDGNPNFLSYWTEKFLERPCPLGSSINDVTRFWRKIDLNSPSCYISSQKSEPLPKMTSQTYDFLRPKSSES
jgi:hypothetical protein